MSVGGLFFELKSNSGFLGESTYVATKSEHRFVGVQTDQERLLSGPTNTEPGVVTTGFK